MKACNKIILASKEQKDYFIFFSYSFQRNVEVISHSDKNHRIISMDCVKVVSCGTTIFPNIGQMYVSVLFFIIIWFETGFFSKAWAFGPISL